MHRNRRVSRPLLAGLAVIIGLGLFFYLHNLSRARAADRAARDAQARLDARSSEVVKAATEPSPAIAPTTQPVTQSEIAPLVTTTPPLRRDAIADATRAPAISTSASGTGATPAGPKATASEDALPDLPSARAAPQPHVIASGTPIADASARRQAGDLIAARDILNTALLSGHLSEAEATATRASLSEINQMVFFSPKRFSDAWTDGYEVQSGERLSSIANKHSVTWQLLSRVNGIDPRRLRSGATIKVINGPFHAVVSKSKFRIDLYLGAPGQSGSLFVTSFPVGLGKDDSTPTGTWHVQAGNKILHPRYYSPRGEGVVEADDPKNPLGGYWIGLEGVDGQAVGKNSYGIHGTIDPDSIGKQASMGCIRLRHDDIAMVFDMLVDGKSKIVVTP